MLIGLIQALSEVAYCSLISGFFALMADRPDPNKFFAPLLMLTLLVFSAAMMGLVVFGYAVKLALDKELKMAGKVLMWTFIFLFICGGLLVTIGLLL